MTSGAPGPCNRHRQDHPHPQSFERDGVTGLVLAGGRGQRMGGVDKGLQAWRGRALVDHAIARLAPQVDEVLVSANRHVEDYAARPVRVVTDATGSFDGPLAGILAGMKAARTGWLAVVPCDAPRLPPDLVARLAAGRGKAPAAVVQQADATGRRRLEPVCCLLECTLAADLEAALAAGERKVEPWLRRHGVPVPFDRPGDAGAFANFNTLDDLRA